MQLLFYLKYINNYYKNYQNTPDNFSNWQYLGPIGVASTPGNGSKWSTGKGMITSVYIDPDNHNKILAGAHTSGLWKTENGGDSWIPLTDNYHKIDGISSIVVNPLNKNIIYITSHLGISKYSNGVFKSIDGGVTWNELYFEDENGYPFFPATNYKRIPRKLIMHPENPDTLFLITHSYIFKTTDGGEEWQIIRNEDFIWWNYEFGFYD